MKVRLKIPNQMLAEIRADLRRPHAFAYEGVGFMTAGAVQAGDRIILLARQYQPVADEDYVASRRGVVIGSAAMRKGVQLAYQPRSALIHIHEHGHRGQPEFSGIDLASGREFVPGFFHTVPTMPHGMVVLSEDSATGMVWLNGEEGGSYIEEFIGVGAPYQIFGRRE
jgi:hypothetical protein